MQQISNLQYRPLGSQGDLLALQVLASATDADWTIQNQGTATGDADAANFDPKWLLIDNIANNGIVTVTMGIFAITVPPFQREPIPIPAGTKAFVFNVKVGNVNAYFSANKLADVQGNFLQIQSTSVKTLIYAFVNYSANPTLQATSDLNTSTLFNPTVADMVYNLLSMTTPVGNGWMQFVFNNGTKNVSFTPNGVITLVYDGKTYTNAAPLVLYPGAWGYLESDGAGWYFSGFVGNTISTVASAATTNVVSGSETQTVVITGSVGINGFDAARAGVKREGYFSGAPLLTSSATFILPGGANIQAAANDRFEAISLGGAVGWIITNYAKADGTPIVSPVSGGMTLIASGTPVALSTALTFINLPTNYNYFHIVFDGCNTTGATRVALSVSQDNGATFETTQSLGSFLNYGGWIDLNNVGNVGEKTAFYFIGSPQVTQRYTAKTGLTNALSFNSTTSTWAGVGQIRIYGVK